MCNVIIYVVTLIGLICNQIQASRVDSRKLQKPDFNVDIVLVTFHNPVLGKLISRRQFSRNNNGTEKAGKHRQVILENWQVDPWQYKPETMSNKAKIKQKRKIDKIKNVLKDNQRATNYIHREVTRIKNRGRISDELLVALLYLDKSKNKQLINEILEYYHEEKRKYEMSKIDIWGHKPNNNVIHTMLDRYG